MIATGEEFTQGLTIFYALTGVLGIIIMMIYISSEKSKK